MTRWKVRLSNGESYLEGNFPYEVFESKKSPWLRLQEYLENNHVFITALQIESGTRSFHLPGGDQDPKFADFKLPEYEPTFNFFRKVGTDMDGKGIIDRFAVIEAIYTDYRLQMWVDENNPNHCWVLTKEVE